jgi:hypothetical protein
MSREQVLELTITAFGSALLSAEHADPSIKLELG